MPTITYYRFWCAKCQEYTLHLNQKCIECDSLNESYKLIDVPNEKIAEQRKRYKKAEMDKLSSILSMSRSNMLNELFDESPKTEIIECDAGQKKLDEIAAQKREKAHQEYLEKKKIYKEHFQHLNRNDKCGCGSGLKYKKCCWAKYN